MHSGIADDCWSFGVLLLLVGSFLDGCAFARDPRMSGEATFETFWSFADSGTIPSAEIAVPLASTAGLGSPWVLFHFFTSCACCVDAGSGLSVLFRLILLMKFVGISITGIGFDLCSVAFSMILSPGDSVLHGRRNMDCMVEEVED